MGYVGADGRCLLVPRERDGRTQAEARHSNNEGLVDRCGRVGDPSREVDVIRATLREVRGLGSDKRVHYRREAQGKRVQEFVHRLLIGVLAPRVAA